LFVVAVVMPVLLGHSPVGADTARMMEFRVPTQGPGSPADIIRGPDGNLWFTEFENHKVARMTPGGSVTEFRTGGSPSSITVGGDGNLWFLEGEQQLIGRMTPTGKLKEFYVFSLSYPQQLYGAIAKGPDGNVWYVDPIDRVLGRITPTGNIRETPVPDGPTVITTGPDGNLWFGLQFAPAIGRINPRLTGLTEIPLPPTGNFETNPLVRGITAGPDGNVWYTTSATRVGRVSPSGNFAEFPLPTPGAAPHDITPGPDGNLWFTEEIGNRIGRVTPSGSVREILLPHRDSSPEGITAGPDGRLWFTEENLGLSPVVGTPGGTGRIGSLDPATVRPPPGPCLVVRTSTTLSHDVGPCAGDGIVVAASNLTLDLGGHRVFASHGRRVGDFAGVHLERVNGVTVKRGHVTGFDAGLWVDGGSGNTVSGLDVHDNLGPPDEASRLGDGIVLTHSAGNSITHNVVTHNGVFDGIGVLGLGSNDNLIQANQVRFNTDRFIGPSDPGGGTGIIINSFLEPEALGRGESLTGNEVVDNQILGNVSSGISSISNDGAVIRGNTLDGNGFRSDGSPGNQPGNGIGINANQAATPLTQNVVDGNTITHTADDGIQVTKDGNQVTNNSVSASGRYGIANLSGHSNSFTSNRATGSALFDLFDQSFDAPCDTNTWMNNTYGTAQPDCTTTGGHLVGPALATNPLGAQMQPTPPASRRGRAMLAG
jgi:streptogramin lyase